MITLFQDLKPFLHSQKGPSPSDTLVLSGAYWWLTEENVAAAVDDVLKQWREVEDYINRYHPAPRTYPQHVVLLMNGDVSYNATVREHEMLDLPPPAAPKLAAAERLNFMAARLTADFGHQGNHIMLVGHDYTCLAPVFRMMHASRFEPGWIAKRGYGWRAKSGLPICTGLAFSAATGWATPISLSAVHGIPATAKTHGG